MNAEELEVLNIFTKIYMDLIHEDKYLNSTEEFQKYLTENFEVFEEDKTLVTFEKGYSLKENRD